MSLITQVAVSSFLVAGCLFLVAVSLLLSHHHWAVACAGAPFGIVGAPLAANARVRWARAARRLDAAA